MAGDRIVPPRAPEFEFSERAERGLDAALRRLRLDAGGAPNATSLVAVTFFPTPPAVSCCDSPDDSALCDCGLGEELAQQSGGAVHPSQVLIHLVDAVRAAFPGLVDVSVMSYASNQSVYAAIDELNGALLASGKDFLVSPANFYTFIGTVAPIVTVAGRIAFVRRLPHVAELEEHVGRALARDGEYATTCR